MASECELVEFKAPHQRSRILVARHDNGFTDITDDQLKEFFGRFGLVHEAQILGGGGYHRQDHYAYIKFYSTESARNALQHCNSGAILFRGRPISCTLLKKDRAENDYMTVHACNELANKTLGFNNWSTVINYVKRVDSANADSQTSNIKCKSATSSDEVVEACVDVVITTWRVQHSRGIARSCSSDVENQGVGDGVSRAKKTYMSAIRAAKLAAFRNILIAIFPSGDLEVILKNEVTKPAPPEEYSERKSEPEHTKAADKAISSTLDEDYPADFWDDVDNMDQQTASGDYLLSGDEWDDIDDFDPTTNDTGGVSTASNPADVDGTVAGTAESADVNSLACMDDDPFWDDLVCEDHDGPLDTEVTSALRDSASAEDGGAPVEDVCCDSEDGVLSFAEEGSHVFDPDEGEDGYAEELEMLQMECWYPVD